MKNSFLVHYVQIEKIKNNFFYLIKHDLNANYHESESFLILIADSKAFLFFVVSQVMVVIFIVHSSAIRVETKNDAVVSGNGDDPKAEALTLVVHRFPPSSKLRPIKIIDDRNDEVVVIHNNRPKRKPNSRKRRPSSSQYRSKIKYSTGGSSNFGGFKDFTSNDYRQGSPSDYRQSSSSRFPPFPSKNFGEPIRTSNKYKFGPTAFEGYAYNSPPSKKSKRPSSRPTKVYGPPPSYNQYNQDNSSPFDGQTLQTLQQHHSGFPSYSVDTVEPSSSNYFGTNSERQPISNFPLEAGSSFNYPKTSYGNPVRAQTSSYSNFSYNPSLLATNLSSNQNSNSNFPKLPSRYEPKDFSTPTRTNPLGGSPFLTPDYNSFNDVSESQNLQTALNQNQSRNRFKNFNKFNNFDYDFKGQTSGQKNSSPSEEGYDDESDNLESVYSTRRPLFASTTTTTSTEAPPVTKRPKKNVFGKRKRPVKVSQTHILDTDDLREAFTESTDFHEVALSSDDFINFDSQRHNKRAQNSQFPHEIHSTLKTARKQSSALRSALGDDYQIVSIEKSLEKNPSEVGLGFQRKSDDHVSVGSDLSFGPTAEASSVWQGDFENFPRNHRFS